MYFFRTHFLRLAALFLALSAVACDSGSSQPSSHAPREPGGAEQCPVCGMKVLGWPGPKGQLLLTSSDSPLFFDNTVDLMVYVLHPDHRDRVVAVYVQDMTRADWDQPDVAPWIDARQAWFVAGHNRMGSMGPTLASFAEEAAAQAFRDQFQGEVLRYQDVNQELLRFFTGATPAARQDHHPHDGHDH
jgi:copper chaperone NosL